MPMQSVSMALHLLVISTCLLVANTLIPGTCLAQTEGLECLYQRHLDTFNTPGTATQLKVVDGYLYLADHDAGLSIYDLSDPENPVLISSTPTPERARLVEVVGSLVYVTYYWSTTISGVAIYDTSNLQMPRLVGNYTTEFAQPITGMSVEDSTICLAGSFQLLVIDASNPSAPALAGTLSIDEAADVVIRDNHAYVAAKTGLHIIDISSPSAPIEVGFVGLFPASDGSFWNTHCKQVLLVDDVAYLVGNRSIAGSVLFLVDISNLSNPTNISYLHDFSIDTTSLNRDGDRLYVGSASLGFAVYDIQDPHQPELASVLTQSFACSYIDVHGDFVYAVTGQDGVAVFNLANIGMSLVSTYTDFPRVSRAPTARYVAIDGDYGFFVYDAQLRGEVPGVDIVDISDPYSPSLVSRYPSTDPTGAVVRDGLLYIADDEQGLDIVDITDINNPVRVGLYNTPGDAQFVYVDGFVAYVADRSAGLHIIDVNEPTDPQLLGTYNSSGSAYVAQVFDGIAYLADGTTILILDVSDPNNIQELGSLAVTLAWDLEVVFPYVYLPNGNDGLAVIDVSNPAIPIIAATHDAGGFDAHGITHAGNRVYMTNHESLLVFDVSDPINPELVGMHITIDDAEDVTISGNYAFVPDWYGGVHIFDISSDCSIPCLPDTNHDGTLSPADFSAWVAAFNASAPECDQNGDGVCSPADFSAWVANYNAGC